MSNRQIRQVYGGLCVHLMSIDTSVKKELQDKCVELKAQLDELDVSVKEQLQGTCVEETEQIAKFSDDIDILGDMICNMENLINDAADAVADKQNLSDGAQESYKKNLNRCRNVVGNLIWLQQFFKKEIRYAAKNRNLAKRELPQLQAMLKERRRLQRELAKTELHIKRIEQVEAEPQKRILR